LYQTRQLADGSAYIWRWTGIDGRMLAQTLGCVRQFGVVASLGQPAGRILLLGWKSASEHCVISSRGHQRGYGRSLRPPTKN